MHATQDAARLLADPGIVRNRLKIASTITNARRFLAVQKEFGTFDAYIWSLVGGSRSRTRASARRRFPPRPPNPTP